MGHRQEQPSVKWVTRVTNTHMYLHPVDCTDIQVARQVGSRMETCIAPSFVFLFAKDE